MNTLTKRIDALEQTPQAQSAKRIARAIETGNLASLTDRELETLIAELACGPNPPESELIALGLDPSDAHAIASNDWQHASDAALERIMQLANEEMERLKQGVNE